MAIDKAVDSAVLDAGLSQIAKAIRSKGGTSANLSFPTGFANAIADLQTDGETPVISVNSSGLITATAGDKSATKQLTTQAAQTITPGTSNKTIASGRYLTGTQTIAGDADLVAGNIKKGVSIFGVTGTLETGSGGNFAVAEVTLASNYGSTVGKKIGSYPLAGVSFLEENLFAMLVRKDTTEQTYSIPIVMACNTAYLNGSYSLALKRTSYGVTVAYRAGDEDYKLSNATGWQMARIYMYNGGVYIIAESGYSFLAGTYYLIVGVLQGGKI